MKHYVTVESNIDPETIHGKYWEVSPYGHTHDHFMCVDLPAKNTILVRFITRGYGDDDKILSVAQKLTPAEASNLIHDLLRCIDLNLDLHYDKYYD